MTGQDYLCCVRVDTDDPRELEWRREQARYKAIQDLAALLFDGQRRTVRVAEEVTPARAHGSGRYPCEPGRVAVRVEIGTVTERHLHYYAPAYTPDYSAMPTADVLGAVARELKSRARRWWRRAIGAG